MDDIYSAVGAVATAAFTQTEIDEGDRALFLLPWMANMESPAQIGPALGLLMEMRGSPVERQLLSDSVTKAIDRHFDDDRSFTYVFEREGLPAKIARLLSGLGDDHLKSQLLSSFRSFLTKNLKTMRCKDNEFPDKEKIPDTIGRVNFLFPEKPLVIEDVLYSDLTNGPEIQNYWQSPSALEYQKQFREVRTSQNRDYITPEEWEGKVTEFLDSLDGWNSSEKESESDVFNQKCVLYRVLIGIIPNAKLKRNVIRQYMRFLAGSPTQNESFIEWFFHVRNLYSGHAEIFKDLVRELPNTHFRLLDDFRATGI